VDADGNFLFTDIPVGRYYLMNPNLSSAPSDKNVEFEVKPGEETQLGEITPSQIELHW
jgi:hypothetical protein